MKVDTKFFRITRISRAIIAANVCATVGRSRAAVAAGTVSALIPGTPARSG